MDAEKVKRRLASGDYSLAQEKKRGKSEVWQEFHQVHNEKNEPVGYVQCKACDTLFSTTAKRRELQLCKGMLSDADQYRFRARDKKVCHRLKHLVKPSH